MRGVGIGDGGIWIRQWSLGTSKRVVLAERNAASGRIGYETRQHNSIVFVFDACDLVRQSALLVHGEIGGVLGSSHHVLHFDVVAEFHITANFVHHGTTDFVDFGIRVRGIAFHVFRVQFPTTVVRQFSSSRIGGVHQAGGVVNFFHAARRILGRTREEALHPVFELRGVGSKNCRHR